jgi:ABC-type Zn uptake system ZnuABC Zn-binding protein ZnuA
MIFSSMPAVLLPRALPRAAAALAATAVATIAVAGCGDTGAGAKSGRITVVATTTQVADLARDVGNDRIDVRQILAPNADPHDYEVRPDDIRSVSGADLVIRSGGDLDGWLSDAISSSGTEAPVLTLIDKVPTRRLDSEVDPHWWQDPRNAERAVAEIRDELVAVDGANAAAYKSAAAAYTKRIAALDTAVEDCMARIPAARRKLVTTHDALGYYADRYGIDVIGAVIPSLSTQGQPSAGQTAELIRTIKGAGVSAIFAESSVNPKVEQAIAAEAGATVGKPLWADTLGPKGSAGGTYLSSIASNTRALVDGFTDGRTRCRLPD